MNDSSSAVHQFCIWPCWKKAFRAQHFKQNLPSIRIGIHTWMGVDINAKKISAWCLEGSTRTNLIISAKVCDKVYHFQPFKRDQIFFIVAGHLMIVHPTLIVLTCSRVRLPACFQYCQKYFYTIKVVKNNQHQCSKKRKSFRIWRKLAHNRNKKYYTIQKI